MQRSGRESIGPAASLLIDLGWPEQVDQVRCLEVAEGWLVEDGEPWLGWSGFGIGASGLDHSIPHEMDLEADLDGSRAYDGLGRMQYEVEWDDSDREPNGDEQDCNLAGATTELEYCFGDYDGPLLIPGGNELVAS